MGSPKALLRPAPFPPPLPPQTGRRIHVEVGSLEVGWIADFSCKLESNMLHTEFMSLVLSSCPRWAPSGPLPNTWVMANSSGLLLHHHPGVIAVPTLPSSPICSRISKDLFCSQFEASPPGMPPFPLATPPLFHTLAPYFLYPRPSLGHPGVTIFLNTVFATSFPAYQTNLISMAEH